MCFESLDEESSLALFATDQNFIPGRRMMLRGISHPFPPLKSRRGFRNWTYIVRQKKLLSWSELRSRASVSSRVFLVMVMKEKPFLCWKVFSYFFQPSLGVRS